MAYETGTAAGYSDLLDKLIAFVTTNTELVSLGQNWVAVAGGAIGTSQVVLKGPGLSGSEEIYVGIYRAQNTTNDTYNWGIGGAVGWSPTTGYAYHSGWRYMYLWQHSIPYWFIANGQRIIVIAKISTTYHAMYAGKFFPYATPAQYPYPIYIGAEDQVETDRWSKDNEDIGTFQSPRRGSRLFYTDSTWKTVMNYYESSGSAAANTDVNVWPTGQPANSNTQITGSVTTFPDGGYALLPLILHMSLPAINVLGELDGVFWVTGQQNAAENIITVGADNYLVVQDIYRTARNDYFAVRLA